MRMLGALAGRSLRRHAGLITGLAIVLAAFQVLLVVIARNLQRAGLFSQLSALVPPVFLEAFGGSVITSFSGLSAFGFFHPVVVLTLCCGAIYLASELAGDVDEGLVDLIAARPVPRRLIVTRSALVSGGVSALTVALMLLANRAALAWLAPSGSQGPRASAMLWVAANLVAVAWCFGAAGLALAAYVRRRATAVGVAALNAVVLYLLHFAAASWAPARPFALVSPFHYYEGMRTLIGMHNPRPDIVVLLAASLALSVCAYVLYGRRDL
jgi:ABC-type transport system involved in multi-copper enzyme maturation permease subunit